MQVDTPLGEEGDTALRVAGLVLGEVLELVVLVFVVADVAVTVCVSCEQTMSASSCLPLASKVQALCAIVPEGHADARN